MHLTYQVRLKRGEMKSKGISRRIFLESAGKCLLCAEGTGTILSACNGSPTENEDDNQNGTNPVTFTIDLTDPSNAALTTIGGALKFDMPGQDLPIIVIRMASDEVLALSSKCTHQGLEVNLPANNMITCPWHGSTFDINGNQTGGPAPAGTSLTEFPASLAGNIITVTLS